MDLYSKHIQGRLLILAAVFVFLYASILTLSPSVRLHTWETPLRWEHWVAVLAWGFCFGLIHWQLNRLNVLSDPYLIPIAGFLSGWGVLTIFRLAPQLGYRQSLWLALGGVLFSLLLRLGSDLTFLRRYKYLWLSGGLLLTGLTFFFGSNPLGDGPQLWLGCCGFYFQPSEPLKLLLVIFLSAYLADFFNPLENNQPRKLRTLLVILVPTVVISGIVVGLLIAQRDLGTSLIFLFLYAVMIYQASGEKRFLIGSLVAMIALSLAGYLLFDVVRLRIEAWLNPWLDPTGRSFQIVQSLIAIANGSLAGRGPGLGSPGLVPVSFSDFIFAAITEESGLAGAMALLLILGLLVNRGLRVAIEARNSFLRYLATGLTAYFTGQSILIIAGNLRVLPLTGVTLPFVSYGGSSLMTSFLALAALVQIGRSERPGAYPLPDRRPILTLALTFSLGLSILTLATGWWTIVRGAELLARTDNPRRALNDRYVRRGTLLDRSNQVLTTTGGVAGNYSRDYQYPDLGPVIGYTSPVYGQSGLELSLDDYLRGLRGSPQMLVWSSYLLYGQYPPGLDARLSLDLPLQQVADQAMAGSKGAVVMLDAQSGEVLVMASHPTFNANTLEEDWPNLIQDPGSPLINRAAQGSYQPGPILGPLWLAAYLSTGADLPALPDTSSMRIGDDFLSCAITPFDLTSFLALVSAGCPRPSADMVASLAAMDETAPQAILENMGLYSAPQLRMPVSLPSSLEMPADLESYAVGQSTLRISPLQLALAMAPLSSGGVQPAERITLAVNTPQSGWVVLPPLSEPRRVLTSLVAQETAGTLAAPNYPFWFSTARAINGSQMIAWYVAGTLPGWRGSPRVLVVLLEGDQPGRVRQIGEQIMLAALALP
jgi:cell division protein FtsW (lipid II flippase)